MQNVTMVKKYFFIYFFIFISNPTFAADDKSGYLKRLKNFQRQNFHYLSPRLGNYSPMYNRAQTNRQGEIEKWGFRPYMGISYDLYLENLSWFSILGQLDYAFAQDGKHEVYEKSYISLDMNAKFNYLIFSTYLGPGVLQTQINGHSGISTLRNGSSVQSYPNPQKDSYSTAYYLNWGIGVEEFIASNLGLHFQTLVFSPFSSQFRTVEYKIALSYLFKLPNFFGPDQKKK